MANTGDGVENILVSCTITLLIYCVGIHADTMLKYNIVDFTTRRLVTSSCGFPNNARRMGFNYDVYGSLIENLCRGSFTMYYIRTRMCTRRVRVSRSTRYSFGRRCVYCRVGTKGRRTFPPSSIRPPARNDVRRLRILNVPIKYVLIIFLLN